ncbi:transposase IS3/IS911 family protein [Salinisphaera dokdonensis CL-ES53]|uniref:Transposase IS3/IS911 family protein n=1 Tax=Salinisphaera dokdonensis CL-ES53 TaxID=1304272 RepID=A0ABV2B3U0_9GAMM
MRIRSAAQRHWVRQAELARGLCEGETTEARGRIKALEHENRGLERANQIVRMASAILRSRRPASDARHCGL